MEPGCKPFSLLGGPGFGKTTVVLKALHESRVVERFQDRRYFIRCEGISNRDLLVTSLAEALGVSGRECRESGVLEALSIAPACLVLDNFETPWEGDAQKVEEWLGVLAGLPSLKLGITCRGLQQPPNLDWQEAIRVGPIPRKDAKTLFLAIAGKKHAMDPDVDTVVEYAAGVPLVLSLLGFHAQAEPDLASLKLRWELERVALLKRGRGDTRELNFSVSLEISLNSPRMTAGARQTLSALALLPGGLSHADLHAFFPAIQGDVSILRQLGLAYDESKRLRILPPIHEYVRHHLPPDPRLQELLRNFFLGMVREWAPRVGWRGGRDAVQRLASEAVNIEAMLIVGLEEVGSEEEIDSAIKYGNLRCLSQFGSETPLEKALSVAQRKGLKKLEAKVLEKLGDIALQRSDHAAARGRYEQALFAYRQVGFTLGEANCLQSLGDIALRRWDHGTAMELYGQARPLYGQVGSLLGEANCIKRLGDIALERSDHATARRQFELALPLYRQVGDAQGEANCIKGLGDIALERSDNASARENYEQALPLYRQVGSVLGEANCIRSLGDVALERSEQAEARERYEQTLPLYRQIGDVLGEANCIKRLGDIALQCSDHSVAREQYGRALHLFRHVGAILGEANCIQCLGDIALACPGDAGAREYYDEALSLYAKVPEPNSMGWTHLKIARLELDHSLRMRSIAAAASAWRSIDRPDLIQSLLREFNLSEAELAGQPA
jgi:tetratricopeptide (TPR) repeat protein